MVRRSEDILIPLPSFSLFCPPMSFFPLQLLPLTFLLTRCAFPGFFCFFCLSSFIASAFGISDIYFDPLPLIPKNLRLSFSVLTITKTGKCFQKHLSDFWVYPILLPDTVFWSGNILRFLGKFTFLSTEKTYLHPVIHFLLQDFVFALF